MDISTKNPTSILTHDVLYIALSIVILQISVDVPRPLISLTYQIFKIDEINYNYKSKLSSSKKWECNSRISNGAYLFQYK